MALTVRPIYGSRRFPVVYTSQVTLTPVVSSFVLVLSRFVSKDSCIKLVGPVNTISGTHRGVSGTCGDTGERTRVPLYVGTSLTRVVAANASFFSPLWLFHRCSSHLGDSEQVCYLEFCCCFSFFRIRVYSTPT